MAPQPHRRPRDRELVLGQLSTLAETGRAALGRLAAAARSLVRSRTETRRLLSDDVYRVPDDWLDDTVRVRLEDLEDDDEPRRDGADTGTGG